MEMSADENVRVSLFSSTPAFSGILKRQCNPIASSPSSHLFYFLICQYKDLLCFSSKQSRHAHIKTSLFRQSYSGINVGSTLKFLPEASILLKLGKLFGDD